MLNEVSLGTFLKDITPDPTWAYDLIVTDLKNCTGAISEIFRFCDGMQWIEQPNGHKNTCPPEKGFGLISIEAYVLRGEFEPVILCSYEAVSTEQVRLISGTGRLFCSRRCKDSGGGKDILYGCGLLYGLCRE